MASRKRTLKSYGCCAKSLSAALITPNYNKWWSESRVWWDFYDGNQWKAEEITELKNRSQPVVVINKVKAPIKNLTGTEIQTRSRVQYKARNTRNPQEGIKADALSEFALFLQEQANAAYYQSQKFKETLVGGIGWSTWRVEGDRFVYEKVDAEEMVWDANDKTPQMNDQSFVARQRWMQVSDAVARFPSFKNKLEKYMEHQEKRRTGLLRLHRHGCLAPADTAIGTANGLCGWATDCAW